MLIGIPKELKSNEYRVSMSPLAVRELVYHGHRVLVQKNAGDAVNFDDAQYRAAGAVVVDTIEEIYNQAEMVVKVKEPQLEECSMIQDGQIIFSFFHLAAIPKITNALLDSKCIAIAYETVTAPDGSLPLLAPMSEVAGRVAVQAGAHCLEREQGGAGVLLGGVPGVSGGKVTIIGGGTVGMYAAITASGLGADVTILDRSVARIRQLNSQLDKNVNVLFSTMESVEEHVTKSDLVIGAVLIPGAVAPKIVDRAMVKRMPRGSVIVDVAIDQGGCIETSRPTTYDNPSFVEEGVIHYCVTNLPSAVARTATRALENSTLPYILALADKGYRGALKEDEHFRRGLNIYRGRITHEAVANDLKHAYVPPCSFLS